MNREATRFDRIIQGIKNNRIIAYVLILGTCIIVVSQLTDATSKLYRFISGKTPAIDVSGIWKTEILKDPWFVDKYYKYIFELERKSDTISGVLKRIYGEGQEDSTSIFDGKIQADFISFYIQDIIQTRKTIDPYQGKYVWERVPYKVIFKGTIVGDKIDFLITPEWPNFEPWRIEAMREGT